MATNTQITKFVSARFNFEISDGMFNQTVKQAKVSEKGATNIQKTKKIAATTQDKQKCMLCGTELPATCYWCRDGDHAFS